MQHCNCLRGRSDDDGYSYNEDFSMFVHVGCGLPVLEYANAMRRKAVSAWMIMANFLMRD